jgi:predicted enzyme related to lactoylglutathione lyase
MKFEVSPFVAVHVREYEKAVDFYKRVMGMELMYVKDVDTYLKSGQTNFVIEDNPENAGKAVFFEFKVDSVKDATELLEKEGCKVTKVYNPKSVMFADPYGMKFHLYEEGAFD